MKYSRNMEYKNLLLRVLLLFLALAVVGAGCGNSSGSSNSSGASGAADAPAATKAKFIREADEICRAMDKEQDAAIEAFLSTHPEGQMSKAMEDAFTKVVGLQPVLTQADELADLSPPSGDKKQVEEIIQGIEDAVAEAEKDPSSILKEAGGPFAEVDSLSEAYGFKVCSSAL